MAFQLCCHLIRNTIMVSPFCPFQKEAFNLREWYTYMNQQLDGYFHIFIILSIWQLTIHISFHCQFFMVLLWQILCVYYQKYTPKKDDYCNNNFLEVLVKFYLLASICSIFFFFFFQDCYLESLLVSNI